MKILIVTASPMGENSHSRKLAEYVAQKLGGEVTIRDLYEQPIPYMQGSFIEYNYGRIGYEDLSDEDKKTADLQRKLVEEVLGHEYVVLAVPMWNLTSPAVFKGWIDLIVKMPEVLSVGPQGYEGKLTNIRQCILCGSMGGTGYLDGAMAKDDFMRRYTQRLFEFLGVGGFKTFYVEGMGRKDIDEDNVFEKTKQLVDTRISTIRS